MYKNKRYRVGSSSILTSQNKLKDATSQQSSQQQSNVLTSRNQIEPVLRSPIDSDNHEILSSQISIPPSQPVSQRRFISQRSNAIRLESGLRSAGCKRIPNSYYESILMKCGITFDNPEYYVLGCDHITFVNRLRELLKSNPDFPTNVQQFTSGFKESIADKGTLIKTLGSCMINIPNTDIIPQSQESLSKNFIVIDFLQSDIILILLERLKQLVINDNNTDSIPNLVILILSQLKFVNQALSGEQLYHKLIEILESATLYNKRHIIGNIQDIIDIKRHDDIVRQMIRIIPNDEDLFDDITVNALENMCLSLNLLKEIKTKLIIFLKGCASIKLFPSFIKFLLKFNVESAQTLPELITSLRSAITWNGKQNDAKQLHDSQLTVFDCISRALTRSRQLYDIWLRNICTSSAQEEHHPIDLIVLLIMISINDDRSNYIENIIRKKIKNDQLPKDLLERTIIQLPTMIVRYLKIFFEVIDNLFRDKDPKISNLGEVAYKLAFGIEGCDRKLLLFKLVGFVREKHFSDNRNHTDVVKNALTILTEINKIYPFEIQNNSFQILGMLDGLGDISLTHYRLVMDLLCSIAYPLPPITGSDVILNHVDILIKKQITGSVLNIKRQGIVGTVRVIDHLIWHHEESDLNKNYNFDDTINSIDELPSSFCRNAASLIQLVLASTKTCAESLALFYDELAVVFSTKIQNNANVKYFDKPFLNWLCEMITTDFQNYFIIEEIPTHRDIKFDRKYCINLDETSPSPDSDITNIAINIGGLSITPSESSSILVLSPVFNLMRALHFHRDGGNLESINAVLGCAIILPSFVGSADDVDLFNEYDVQKSSIILDMYFYTVNWFREVISAFASQTDTDIRKKVLTRLTELIKLEQNIRVLLKLAPINYSPPNSQFITTQDTYNVPKFKRPINVPTVTTTTKSKKKKQTAEVIDTAGYTDTENMSILATMRTQNVTIAHKKHAEVKSSLYSSYGPKELYRLMDPDLMLLLSEDLDVMYPLPSAKIGISLGLLEYKFIIEDMVMKLESLIFSRQLTVNQSAQYIISPDALVNDIIQFLPRVLIFFKQIIVPMKNAVDLSDGIYDSYHLFTDELNYLKICFGLTLRLFAALFSWPGFQETRNEDLLRKALCIMADVSIFSTTPNESPVKDLLHAGIKKMLNFLNIVLNIQSAVHMFHLIKAIANISNDSTGNIYILKLCSTFLSRPWYALNGNSEKGSQFNILLDELLKGLFINADFEMIIKQTSWINNEIGALKSKDDAFTTFPCFYKANFPLLFRALCDALIRSLNKKIDMRMSDSLHLKTWEEVSRILNTLLDITKQNDIPRNFSIFLKHAHIILKIFLQNGMLMLEINLKKNSERVNELLKNLQQTTRFLHSLCCHSKTIKNAAILYQIPFLRQTIEHLLYRVKAALAANKCSSVFWMGNLKNKDIYGDEILSQISSITRNQEENDEVMSDDESLEENIDNRSNTDVGSGIERFDSENTSRSRFF